MRKGKSDRSPDNDAKPAFADASAAVQAPATWFPPARGPVVVAGNAGNLFPRHLASLWRSMGIDARIVTRRWHDNDLLADGTPIECTGLSETPKGRRVYEWIERGASRVEAVVTTYQARRFRRAMGTETTYRPAVSSVLPDALSISRYIRKLRPQFVCGQEVFSYGLATALSRGVPRVLMPWGGDVYMYADTTTLASMTVGFALRNVDLVVPGSTLARDHLHERFGVSPARMHCGGLWALDRQRFRRATASERGRICAKYGIDPSSLLVMNIRRFFPAWGCDVALKSLTRFAKRQSKTHVIMLGGNGTERFVASAREILANEGLSRRFTIFDGDLPLEDCASLMSTADIGISLMRERDMRPFASILEAASCGAALVLGDQAEYRAMERLGFQAALCPSDDLEAVVRALERYAGSASLREEVATLNQDYLDRHEDGRKQATDLLQRIRAICDTYERDHRRTRGSR
jgi:glycosyltransferase involved in cell wall biosynthesis